jgi:CubicO group peptidase (beta-lactamase class C family)
VQLIFYWQIYFTRIRSFYMTKLMTIPNPELMVTEDNKAYWNLPDNRRWGFHNLHRVYRYGATIRSPEVLRLTKRIDSRITDMPEVQRLTSLPCFSGMVVVRGQNILYEAYAPDFGPTRPHSIQSITKTMMNLVMGGLVEEGLIDLNRSVSEYLSEIGSGYAGASVQQVLDMNVSNDFTEDYHDPHSTVYQMESSIGWRLPKSGDETNPLHQFLCKITGNTAVNSTGHTLYKSTNTDVLGWIAERVTGRRLLDLLIPIVEAAGIEGTFHISTDVEGVPLVDGGVCLTARDLARYGLLFVRRGQGVNDTRVGSADFIEKTRHAAGTQMPPPREWLRYSNQTNTDGRWLGHGGYGGQYMLADLDSGVVVAFFSVLENRDAYEADYYPRIIEMGAKIGRLEYDKEI